jgi:hypothetical protein
MIGVGFFLIIKLKTMNVSILILLTLFGLIVGGGVSYLIFKNNLKKKSNSLLSEAQKEG